MIREILLASHNRHKAEEIRILIPSTFRLLTLSDIDFHEEIPEPFHTYEENAKAKAFYVFERTGLSTFADDSGLEIDALNGRPGVYSAHYSGTHGDAEGNIQKVLAELKKETERSARFISVIAFIQNEQRLQTFKGIVEGRITNSPVGDGGFGYDPIFMPDGFDMTFGQLSDMIKNKISHRAKAMHLFVEYLKLDQ